jgi:thiol-disulfide isomerase/thioredoxin
MTYSMTADRYASMAVLTLRTLFSVLAVMLLSLSASNAVLASAVPDLDLQRYEGKVVIVDFWASWCAPCRRSFPWLNSMQARYEDQGLVIIGVNLDESREKADKFLTEFPASFAIYFDSSKSLAREFGVEAMPSSFVIGREGSIIARHAGFKEDRQDEYEAILVEALGLID